MYPETNKMNFIRCTGSVNKIYPVLVLAWGGAGAGWGYPVLVLIEGGGSEGVLRTRAVTS